MERMPPVESPKTPEKSRELYFEALKAKRDVLSSHYTLGQLRKGRRVAEMSDEDIENYKSVKKEYDKRRELFLASFDNLNEDDSQKVAEPTSLTKVEIALSTLEKSAETEVEVMPADEVKALEAEQNIPEVELIERQEAEANPDRPAPKGFMQRVRDSFGRAKEAFLGVNRISGGSETVESRMSPLGLRHEPLTPTAPSESVDAMSQPEVSQPEPVQPETTQPEVVTPQQERQPQKASAWGWLKERGKGFLTFGFWETYQAERFRHATKETANDTKALSTLIQQERNLSLEEAEKEAWETVEELKKNNLDISAPEFYQANRDITERKRKENNDEIEYIIKNAGNDLVEKLAKYRGEAGQDVLTLENKAAFEADLRGELNKMRDGAMRKDFINFAKLMRRNLDEKWWRRYIYGPVESYLMWTGVFWLSFKFLASKEAAAVATKGVAGGAESVKNFVETGMNQNVWHSLEQMAQNGPAHFTPTPEQLMEWSKSVLDTNHWYEPEWVKGIVEGLKSSRILPEGTVMKIPTAVMKAMGY